MGVILMELSKKVEIQLQEILENRPNEQKVPVRRRNKEKDVIKKIKRGSGYNIERSIITKQLAPIIDEKINMLDLSNKIIKLVQLPINEETYYISEMLNQEEIQENYPGYSVTQTKRNDTIELVVRKYQWALTPMRIKPYKYTDKNSVVISSSLPDTDNTPVREYRLSNVLDIANLPFIKNSEEINLREVEKITQEFYEKEIMDDVYLNRSLYIDKESSDILRLIEKNKYSSKWFDQENIYIRRNELNSYIKEELKRQGDFGKLDNRVDLFQIREYIY